MDLVFQLDSEKNVPFMFGDAGVGHITQCPTHKDVVAFTWACCSRRTQQPAPSPVCWRRCSSGSGQLALTAATPLLLFLHFSRSQLPDELNE